MIVRPNKKQHKALQILMNKNGIKYLLFGGAAGGSKSICGCFWLIIMCMKYPGTKYFIGRDTLKELRGSTLQSFYKAIELLELDRNLIKVNGQDNYIEFQNGSRIDLLACTYLPSDPFYERFGSFEYTCGWLEEAGEIDFEAFDTLKSRIGRQYNDKYDIESKIFITCNPKKNWLYREFYKPWQNGTNVGFDFIQAKVQDNPDIDKTYIDNLYNISNLVKKQRLLHGNWEYDNSSGSLCEYDKISYIFKNQPQTTKDRYISADIANVGKDRTIIILWYGLHIKDIIKLEQYDIPRVADQIKMLASTHQVSMKNVVVDANGLGIGVKDILKCVGFINNAKAENNESYDSLKSQCAFKLSEFINKDMISCKELEVNEKEDIISELELLKQVDIDSDKKLKIISKDVMKSIIGKSPDYLDAILMRMYYELRVKGGVSFYSIKNKEKK